ncbi:MAG TPA: carbohydrate ABC transporter permease, partial [Candidatus Limnocylindrales bacterium]
MTAVARAEGRSFSDRSPVARSYRKFLGRSSILMFALVIISAYLLPLLYMVTTAFQQPGQSTTPGAPVYPATAQTATYHGQDYPVYSVPMPDGATRQLILVEPGRESSVFIDPTDASETKIEWVGRWRTLQQTWTFAPLVDNFTTAWNQLNFPRLLRNTFLIALLSTIGAVLSSTLVAYGFARFRFRGKNALFVILIATIILPIQVTLLPQYVLFTWLGWNGTWLPLIIPHCFANAYNVFLLRQYFLSIPRELDEAAMID